MKDSCRMIVCQISNRIFWRATACQPIITQDSQRDSGTLSLHHETSVLQREALLLQRKSQGIVLRCDPTGTVVNLQLRTQHHLPAPRSCIFFRFSGDKNTSGTHLCLIATCVCAINVSRKLHWGALNRCVLFCFLIIDLFVIANDILPAV